MLEQKTQPYPRTGGAQGKTLCQAPSLPCCSPGGQKICLVLELGRRWQGIQGQGGSCPPQQVEGAEQGPGAQQRAMGWLVTRLWSASPHTNTRAGQHNSCVTENVAQQLFAPRRGAAVTRGAVREELGPEGTCTHGAAGTAGRSQVSVPIPGPDAQLRLLAASGEAPSPWKLAAGSRQSAPCTSFPMVVAGRDKPGRPASCLQVPGKVPVPASTHPQCGKCLTQIRCSLASQVPHEKQVLDAASDHE